MLAEYRPRFEHITSLVEVQGVLERHQHVGLFLVAWMIPEYE
jgi:hypothetical protein